MLPLSSALVRCTSNSLGLGTSLQVRHLKFPKACTATDAITHRYKNYTRPFSKNHRIWPLFFHAKCNFYLKLIFMRIICKQTYASSSVQHICMQRIPFKGYQHYDLGVLQCKNTLPVSKKHSKQLVVYLPYYNENN